MNTLNNGKIGLLKGLSALSQLLGIIFKNWKLFLITAFFVSETGPHLRWKYTYRGNNDYRNYIRCVYLGARGFISIVPKHGDCPVVSIINAKTGEVILP